MRGRRIVPRPSPRGTGPSIEYALTVNGWSAISARRGQRLSEGALPGHAGRWRLHQTAVSGIWRTPGCRRESRRGHGLAFGRTEYRRPLLEPALPDPTDGGGQRVWHPTVSCTRPEGRWIRPRMPPRPSAAGMDVCLSTSVPCGPARRVQRTESRHELLNVFVDLGGALELRSNSTGATAGRTTGTWSARRSGGPRYVEARSY
ncbi:hypothetical protein DAEQUDRAFT_302915 [Daedalea quercina L-15889]|uniref:Uncharacterized protein n=1 Tax=Daedalea quercina L-15889 TaxID=1314783 RepID=A0A165Q693_9APHY|nr:hypothetical protein DAEQUDRAFT_302915 [Daedalea quercina L-15889]